MKQLLTRGIVLSRTDYGEADRIITVLTPDYGKLRLMARGVRKVKSKLAGGIELFSVSHVTFIKGKGDIDTLVSTRLVDHYGNIVKDIGRVQLGYDLIKQLNKTTEDHPEEEYFDLLHEAFKALDDQAVDQELIKCWFQAQLLKLAGHSPNLQTDTNGRQLNPETQYNFDFEAMTFVPAARGRFVASHIKLLRLLFAGHPPVKLQNIQDITQALTVIRPLINGMGQTYLQR